MSNYYILTNIFFTANGEFGGGNNEERRILAACERREDAEGLASLLDQAWVEDCREWDVASGSWRPLTEAQANARPVVRAAWEVPETFPTV